MSKRTMTCELRRRRRWVLLWAQDCRCAACGLLVDLDADPQSGEFPTLDHVLPKADRGPDDLSNLLVKHSRCNNRRGDRPANRNDAGWRRRVQVKLLNRPETIAECERLAREIYAAAIAKEAA